MRRASSIDIKLGQRSRCAKRWLAFLPSARCSPSSSFYFCWEHSQVGSGPCTPLSGSHCTAESCRHSCYSWASECALSTFLRLGSLQRKLFILRWAALSRYLLPSWGSCSACLPKKKSSTNTSPTCRTSTSKLSTRTCRYWRHAKAKSDGTRLSRIDRSSWLRTGWARL